MEEERDDFLHVGVLVVGNSLARLHREEVDIALGAPSRDQSVTIGDAVELLALDEELLDLWREVRPDQGGVRESRPACSGQGPRCGLSRPTRKK